MENPKLKADLSGIQKLENFKKLKYNDKTIKYSNRYILYSKALLRFENITVVCGEFIFIQSPDNVIFFTDDLKKFNILATGQIVGIVERALIYKNEDSFYIFNAGITISLYFYFKNEKLLYSHSKDEKTPIIIENYLIYDEFLVISSDRNVLFVNLNSTKDTQYRFPSCVIAIRVVEVQKISFLAVSYFKKSGITTALIYKNHLLTQKVIISSENGKDQIFILPTPFNNGEVQLSADGCFDAMKSKIEEDFYLFSEHNGHRHDGNSSILIDIKDLGDTIKSSFQADKVVPDYHLASESINENRNNADITRLFSLTDLQLTAFLIAKNTQKIQFLDAIFNNKQYDIISEVSDKLIHMSGNASNLLVEHRSSFKSIGKKLIYENTVINSTFSFFYENVKNCMMKKNLNLNFGKILTHDEIKFLNRKYHRVFHYDSQIKKSENLAYKIISFEEKNKLLCTDSRFKNSGYIENYTSFNKSFTALLNFHFSDQRMSEIINIMLENQIVLSVDTDDLQSYRLGTFCARSYLNIGSLILNHKVSYYYSIHNLPIKINSQNADQYVSPETIFLNAACTSLFYKEFTSNTFYTQLGKAFGIGLVKGLTDDEIQQFLKLIPSAEDDQLKFILLVLSTKKVDEPHLKSLNINKVLKSGLISSNFELRKATVCSLAIYNYRSNDFNILNVLQKELYLRGPVDLEKNSKFYDRNYRILVSLAMGSITTRPFYVESSDSFSNLLVLGLSSINHNIDSNEFFRADDCRLDEIFYSALFTLTSNFETEPMAILSQLTISNLQSDIEILRSSAKIFYIGLYLLKEPRKSFDLVYSLLKKVLEALEIAIESNAKLKILFLYTLCACSIAKSGTCDFYLLKMLRKEVLITKEIKYMSEFTYFDYVKKELVTDKRIDKETMQFYKMCIGIVTSNFGMSRLSNDSIKQLIITFFYTGSITLDFSYIDILRCQIARCLESNKQALIDFEKSAFELMIRDKRRKAKAYFKSKFQELPEIDQKVVIDILSDYYENHNTKLPNDTIFDMKLLANLMCISK